MPLALPPSPSRDIVRVVRGRATRGLADGCVSVLLAPYLVGLGFSPTQVGAIVTATLVGSAGMTLLFGLRAHRTSLRTLLLVATGMMVATGIGFATVVWFWPLLVVAVLGTMNPSSGDVSVFLPTEQALLAGEVEPEHRPRLYATYNLGAIFAAAIGSLLAGAPDVIANRTGIDVTTAQRLGFVLYTVAAVVIFLAYRRLPRQPRPAGAAGPNARTEDETEPPPRPRALATSRRTVSELAVLFSVDSAGSGLVVTSLLVLWLQLRFDLPTQTTAVVFFAAGLLGAASQALAPRLARRFGLIRTMVFTHLPANALLMLAAFAPSGGVAIALLLTRALFAQMDVPARQSFVMAVVPADERAAAASVTNVPRSLASATTPLLAGWLLSRTTFGWPLVLAGATKITYDLALLALYRHVPEEEGAARTRRGASVAP